MHAIENLAPRFSREKSEILTHILGLSRLGLIEFYKYAEGENTEFIAVAASQLKKEICEKPYEIFMVFTEKTFERLAELAVGRR